MPTMVPTASGTAFAQGLDGSKGSATSGNAGYYWFSTDLNGGTLFQSNGTSWVQITTGVSAAKVNGLTGATAAARFAGGTTSGAPVSGTFAVGDFVVDQTGKIWICTVAGTPGTWAAGSGGGVTSITGTANEIIASGGTGAVTLSTPQAIGTASSPTFASLALGGLTGAVSASRYVGATASGAPASGTFLTGDWCVDLTAKLWLCTAGGTPGTWSQVGGAGGALTTASAQLGSNVAIASSGVFVDGPSISCAAGTWLIVASISASSAGANQGLTAKLWDGTTAGASGETGTSAGGLQMQITLVAVVTFGGTTTYKVSVTSSTGGGSATLYAAAVNSGAGNNASTIVGIKIG